jgi:hypothetical protein
MLLVLACSHVAKLLIDSVLLCHTGALFTTEDQAKYAKITEKLAKLCTVFTQVLFMPVIYQEVRAV